MLKILNKILGRTDEYKYNLLKQTHELLRKHHLEHHEERDNCTLVPTDKLKEMQAKLSQQTTDKKDKIRNVLMRLAKHSEIEYDIVDFVTDEIFNSLVSKDEPICGICHIKPMLTCGCDVPENWKTEIAVRKIYDYISEHLTDYKTEPVILDDVIDWLDKESE